MGISYNIMSRDYLPSLLEVFNTCFTPKISLEKLEEDFSNPIANYIIAIDEDKDQVIAFVNIWSIASESDIINIGVLPDYRRQNIGSKLIESLIIVCKDINCNKIHLDVRSSNISALKLYEKFKFKQVNTRKNYYSSPKEDGIMMSLEL